nr:FACT complex subunit SPT16-like [Tanacetum cinerariifolium]
MPKTFSFSRLALEQNWRENRDKFWGSATAFAIATPPPSDDLRYLKSSALNIWLLGYEFSETIMVFSDKQIHILCSQRKAMLFYDVFKKSAKEAVNVDVVMHMKAKNEDGSTQMEKILRAVESEGTPILGYVSREAPEGKLLESWMDKLKSSGIKLADVTNGLADLFYLKDDEELKNVEQAAYLIAFAMKTHVVPKLEKVIDEEKKITHASLMEETEGVIIEPSRIKVKLKAYRVDICYPPIFQSGGNFNLRPSASSNDDYLFYDPASVIICALGAQYKCYCANVARTFLIDPNATQSKAYKVLLKAHEAAIGALKVGSKASDVYRAAYTVVEKEAPELTSNLTKSAGTGIGLEFRELGLNLNEKNERILKAGMVLNVSLGFQNLQSKSSEAKSQNYALLLADTVLVTEIGCKVVTSFSTKAYEDVAYSFSVSEEHQAELAPEKNKETAQRLAGGKSATGDGTLVTQEQLDDEEVGVTWEELVEADDDDYDDDYDDDDDDDDDDEEELEIEASNTDKEKVVESDSEEERKRRKMKAFGKSRAGPSSSAPKRLRLKR